MARSLLAALLLGAPALHLSLSSPDSDLGAAHLQLRDSVSFAGDVLPVLRENCTRCHGEVDDSGFPNTEAGLSLMSYADVMKGSEFGAVVEPGDPDGSYLFTMVENGDMPDEGDPLTVEEIERIRAWIEAGAPDN